MIINGQTALPPGVRRRLCRAVTLCLMTRGFEPTSGLSFENTTSFGQSRTKGGPLSSERLAYGGAKRLLTPGGEAIWLPNVMTGEARPRILNKDADNFCPWVC